MDYKATPQSRAQCNATNLLGSKGGTVRIQGWRRCGNLLRRFRSGFVRLRLLVALDETAYAVIDGLRNVLQAPEQPAAQHKWVGLDSGSMIILRECLFHLTHLCYARIALVPTTEGRSQV